MGSSWRLRAIEGVAEALPRPAGLLLGAADESARMITLLGATPVPATAPAKEIAHLAAKVLELVPFGVHVVGSYGCSTPPPLAATCCPPVGLDPPQGSGAAAAAAGTAFTLGGELVAAQSVARGPAEAAGGAWALPGVVMVRCHCDVLLRVTCPPDGVTPRALARAFVDVQQQLAGPQLLFATETVARPGAAPIILTGGSKGTAAKALLGGPSSKGGGFIPEGDPCISLVPLVATGASAGGGPAAAPSFEFLPAPAGSTCFELVLGLDALSLSLSGAEAATLGVRVLAPALRRQLEVFEAQVADRLFGAGGGSSASPGSGPAAAAGTPPSLAPMRAHHFRPPGWAVPITCCYARLSDDADEVEQRLLPQRVELHKLLGLPDDVPMLRLANAAAWGGGGGGEGEGGGRAVRLRDVHVGAAPPAIGGAPSLIRGSYEYYHYMQDRFNDSGWGCAYRSLQTIVSWFRLQQYTAKPVPSHREIQQLLVKLGDKDPSFIGSSNWIGAIELSYILNEYLGITCKIMTVNRGADIPSHARELAAHFESQGTPVMIGGGVLAYTLLGVQFDELTGEAAFLILDPHYTGGEDLKKIQQGTWVAWKVPGDSAAAGGPLYVDDTFYNFLLPQRPSTV